MTYMDDIIGVGESSPEFLAIGYCDVCIQGLSAGAVKIQYKLPATPVLTAPAWTDFPDGSFTADFFQTIFFSQHGVYIKFVGVANNANVYVKAARHNNK
jgi:hypothetical protein